MIEDRYSQQFSIREDYFFRPYVPIPEGSESIVEDLYYEYKSTTGDIPVQLAQYLTRSGNTNPQQDVLPNEQVDPRINYIRAELGIPIPDTTTLQSIPTELNSHNQSEQQVPPLPARSGPVLVFDMSRQKLRRQMIVMP